MGERAWVRADSQKRLAMRSLRAMLRTGVSQVSAGNPAAFMGTLTLMRVCPVLSFWTSSMMISKSSRTKLFVIPLYFANGFPSAFFSVLRRTSSDAISTDLQKFGPDSRIRLDPDRTLAHKFADDDLHHQPHHDVQTETAGG